MKVQIEFRRGAGNQLEVEVVGASLQEVWEKDRQMWLAVQGAMLGVRAEAEFRGNEPTLVGMTKMRGA